MMTKAETTRARLLAVGLDAVSVEGLAGLTLGRLADAAGLSKSGLFAHFRSKERLQIDLLDEMARVANQHVVAPAFASAEGLPRLKTLVGTWLGWSTRAGLRGGCPIAAALFELDDLDGDVRAHVTLLEGRWRGLLADLTRQAVAMGELRHDLDVDQFVWELCGVYLSHHASRRFLRDPAADRRAETAFAALIERSAPHPFMPAEERRR
jgi:AcrR family transcriptional regulator